MSWDCGSNHGLGVNVSERKGHSGYSRLGDFACMLDPLRLFAANLPWFEIGPNLQSVGRKKAHGVIGRCGDLRGAYRRGGRFLGWLCYGRDLSSERAYFLIWSLGDPKLINRPCSIREERRYPSNWATCSPARAWHALISTNRRWSTKRSAK